jgi:type VI protein secretion system component Hcp
MAIDVYLQIDGIKGESTDDKHRDWIECQSVQWGVLQPKSATASTGGGVRQDAGARQVRIHARRWPGRPREVF